MRSGCEEAQSRKTAGRIQHDKFGVHIPTVSPPIIERVWRCGSPIRRKGQAVQHPAVIPKVTKVRGHVTDRLTGRWQSLAIIDRPLINYVALALPAQPGDVGDINRVATAFVVHVRN
ncbi:hypothetical protein SDC9_205302 [bioreactor metagenome]|uniref:Uncharacterized protein n=1 Tax=bioreactor metagenome TaxID=1076179 RepID=A0A645J1Q2_9ZZZZ